MCCFVLFFQCENRSQKCLTKFWQTESAKKKKKNTLDPMGFILGMKG